MEIALIGVGLMGSRMGSNLLKAGFGLRVWNRTTVKAEALVAKGAVLAATPCEAVVGADVVLSVLSDGVATGAIIRQVLPSLTAGVLWIDMSSIQPEEARTQSAMLATVGVSHLDAPVSGGTKGAETGSLAIMVGGTTGNFDQARPVFEAMGRPVLVGPSGAGQLSKLANQAIVAVTIGAVAEAMLLVEFGGADPAAVREALVGGFADSVILQDHGARMTTGNFEPGGHSKSHLKDLNNTLAEAKGMGLTLPETQAIRDRFAHFVDCLGGGDLDHSGLYLELQELQS